ncbi:unnamed protein product [Auanema sp. JU1783]|nr:unnamed protein product [Auanema sp. JU1783]
MSWLFQSKVSKSHFYVWYLGSKEADGVRGSAVVLPVMRQLLKESFKKTPSKATVQISSKGLKLIQSVPAMSRSGKVKMQLVKFQIAANCITYSITGKAPFDDVVGVVMLVLNPEMQSPMHVHCYRCDSAETAQILHANIQIILSKPEVQRSIVDLEHRLFLSGLLVPRTSSSSRDLSVSSRVATGGSSSHRQTASQTLERRSRASREAEAEAETSRRVRRREDSSIPVTSRRLVEELKSKVTSAPEAPIRNSFESLHGTLTRPTADSRLRDMRQPSKLRLFGDTLIRDHKSRSLDNLAGCSLVSTNLRGNSPNIFPKTDLTDPFGQSYERMNTLEGFWRGPRGSSIHLHT